MEQQITTEGLTVEQIDTAKEVLDVLEQEHIDTDRDNLAKIVNEANYLLSRYEESARWVSERKFEVGDFAVDKNEPTPSPEINTVKIVELTDIRAKDFKPADMDKSIAEYNGNSVYPDDDLVVGAVYVNMSSDEVFYFPVSRLRKE